MNVTRKPYADMMREHIQNRLGSQKWYEIVNAGGDEAEIRIFDEIGWFGVTAEAFVAELDAITAPKILVRISSLGGDVFDAVSIANALRLHDGFVTTRVEGIAASAASFIAQAGDHRQIVDSGQLFIHEAHGLTIGNAGDMRDMADILDRQTDVIANIYAERAGRPAGEFRALMEANTWFTAEEAVDASLADEIVKPPRKTQDRPEDRVPSKFAADLEALVGAVEAFADETENVVAFRSKQGKPPLSDDAVASIDKMRAAADRLAGVVTPEDVEEPTAPVQDEIDAAYLRMVELTQI